MKISETRDSNLLHFVFQACTLPGLLLSFITNWLKIISIIKLTLFHEAHHVFFCLFEKQQQHYTKLWAYKTKPTSKKSQAPGHVWCTKSRQTWLWRRLPLKRASTNPGWIKEKIHRQTPDVPSKRSCFAARTPNEYVQVWR